MNKRILILYATLAVIILGAGIILTALFLEQQVFKADWMLIIENPRTENFYYQIPVNTGESFTLSLRNSVSKSMVTGTFLVTRSGLIKPYTTEFTSYGPGLPMDFLEEVKIENGIITVFHNEAPREHLLLWVSPQTEETIIIYDQAYPLFTLSDSHQLLKIQLK
ncbi:MAG: DUF1850 domain-containing protein [Bacillota bacterium]|nr:DUF1850 domain-containing protein [Bacillota bacterium]